MVEIFNIKNQNQDLQLLKNFIDKRVIFPNDIEEILKLILPKQNEKMLINYNVKETGINIAEFNATEECINVTTENLKKYIHEQVILLAKEYDIKDIKRLENYFYLFVLFHEREHSLQYLMGNGTLESSNLLMKNAYNEIFELAKVSQENENIRIMLSKYLYIKNIASSFIERNANIESFDIMCQLALDNNDEEIYNIFTCEKNIMLKMGYKKNTIGSLEKTYKKILMYKKYKTFNKDINCSEEERIRLGLNISEESRQKVLSLGRKNKIK